MVFISYSLLSEEFWWDQETQRRDGREGRVWRRLQCPRPLRMFIPGLRTAEGVWGCRDAARRTRGDWKGPENDLHLLPNCAFVSLRFLHPSRSSEASASSESMSGTKSHQGAPLAPFCARPCVHQCHPQPRHSCWGVQAHSAHQQAEGRTEDEGKEGPLFCHARVTDVSAGQQGLTCTIYLDYYHHS